MSDRAFWLDTVFSRGVVFTDREGVITRSCWICRVFLGLPLNEVIGALKQRGVFRGWQEISADGA